MEVGLFNFSTAVAAFTLFLSISGIGSVSFTIINNCPFTIWPATLTAPNSPPLTTTGLELPAGAVSAPIDGVPAGWSGRIWARTWCTNDPTGKFTCLTGDCGTGQVPCAGSGGCPPVSLVEMTLTAANGLEYYDVSLVDGFNLPVLVVPQGGGGCSTTACGADVNAGCPAELAVRGADGGVIVCKSACLAFGTPEYCCTGDHSTGPTCPPTQYSKMFKAKCPQAYSYAYDDTSSTFTCPTGGNYLIKFCP